MANENEFFNATERHVLHHQGGFSRQLISYWETQKCVPAKHLIAVSRLTGRTLESLIPGAADATDNPPEEIPTASTGEPTSAA